MVAGVAWATASMTTGRRRRCQWQRDRGDGTVDDNGVDAVDANGNQIRGDGTVDDNG